MDITLLKAISAKMDYLDMRHKVLSQNVANADTPGYRAHDVSEPDFSRVLKGITSGARLNVSLDTTNAKHIPPKNDIPMGKQDERRVTYEVAPAENAVILEEEIIKANQNTMDYNTMTSLYSKSITMMRSALGRS